MSASTPQPPLPGIDEADAALTEHLRAALRAKGPGYHPRTAHLAADGGPRFVNRLILETSPYLLQHAHNPVNWFPWGPEAFALARQTGRPVLVSIGYSTCHWCHVMERESFEDEEVARVMNERFVAIKVDREERPDVDEIYMTAVQILTGGGGWPMTVVMTPDKQPFFGGTYFPPRDGARGARRGFLSILKGLSDGYREHPASLLARAAELSQHMAAAAAPQPGGDVPSAQLIERAVNASAARFDSRYGGFGSAPKFPRPAALELLFRHYRRTGEAEPRDMALLTLEAMAAGGIYDHVGGGFHRYSTDERWLVPHFEKMLYDNAQLVPLYLDAFQLTQRDAFARTARDTLAYVAREMTAPGGGFYSATDADSLTPSGHEEEGYFFTWTPDELSSVLGPARAKEVASYYGVTAGGNFEGRSILHRERDASAAATRLGLTANELGSRLDEARAKLYVERSKRPMPLRDGKILTSWNGLMISAFARAAFVLGDDDARSRAEKAADFVWTEMRQEGGRLLRSFNEGRAAQEAFLDDYAFFIQALLDLFESTSRPEWLERAIALQKLLDEGFWDRAHGGYFTTGAHHEALLTRDKPAYDGAEPSGNSVAAMNLLRLAEITTIQGYRDSAERLLSAFALELARSPIASPKLLAALELYLDNPREIFIVLPWVEGGRSGADDRLDAEPLLEPLKQLYLPTRVFVLVREGADLERLAALVPALEGKSAVHGRPTAFVCERGRCERPSSEPAEFAAQLANGIAATVGRR